MMIDKELLERIEKETFTDYEAYDVVGGKENETYLPVDNIEPMLSDLLIEIDRLKEKIEDIIRDREDNYRPVRYEEQVEIYNEMFR